MNQIFCMNYIEARGMTELSPRRRHIDLDKIVSITEPGPDPVVDTKFEIVVQLTDHPIVIQTAMGRYHHHKLKEAFEELLQAWTQWVEGKNK